MTADKRFRVLLSTMTSLLGHSRRQRRLWTASLLALSAGLLFALWSAVNSPSTSLQRTVSDALFSAEPGSPNIVLVTIDEEALAEHGRIQSWSRATHGLAIDSLDDAGARVVVYDVIFADQGADDEALASSIARANSVVLPVAGASFSTNSDGALVANNLSRPVASLTDAGAVLGHANFLTDSDGRVRRLPLALTGEDGNVYPSLDLAAFNGQFGRAPGSQHDLGADSLDLIGRTVPLEEHYSLRINYAGGVEYFTTIPFLDVERGLFDPSTVDGKVVYVGITASGADVHSAPLLDQAAGVEIHANALDTLFRARFLRPLGDWATIGILLAAVIGAALVLPRLRVWLSVVVAAAAAAAYLVVGVIAFRGGYIVEFVDPPVALALVTFVGLAYRAVAERASRQEVHDLFGRYVSSPIADEIVQKADRGDLQLGGELREITVLFADIRGFTPLAERTPPDELVKLLNAYFDILVSEVTNHDGIVNKFAGDAIMALWNAPNDQEDHAFLACSASAAAQRRLESLGPSGPVAHFGFGIHTGTALTGNVGAVGRLEYTAIGGSVNLAARLAQGAGAGEIWISENTFRLLENRFAGERLPDQHLKGIETPVVAYSLKWQSTVQAVPVEGATS